MIDPTVSISLESVTKLFTGASDGDPFLALSKIHLDVRRGEFVALIGPSGCGKSTVLNIAAGLIKPNSGTVSYEGKPVTKVNTEVGYITQADNLLPWRSVWGNIELSLSIRNVPRRQRREMIERIIAAVGLDGFEGHYPSQLSGGMRKRTSLARTLVYGPGTLLMDEPFGALDAILRVALQNELMRMWESEGRTVMFVTHDLEEAILLADKVVVFGTKPGRILHVENVSMSRPRDLVKLRGTTEFTSTWERLWSMIENQLTGAEEGMSDVSSSG